jgi:hypothetical protein
MWRQLRDAEDTPARRWPGARGTPPTGPDRPGAGAAHGLGLAVQVARAPSSTAAADALHRLCDWPFMVTRGIAAAAATAQ